MNRRGFFGRLAGVVAGVGLARTAAPDALPFGRNDSDAVCRWCHGTGVRMYRVTLAADAWHTMTSSLEGPCDACGLIPRAIERVTPQCPACGWITEVSDKTWDTDGQSHRVLCAHCSTLYDANWSRRQS